jgi:hypothetical protein
MRTSRSNAWPAGQQGRPTSINAAPGSRLKEADVGGNPEDSLDHDEREEDIEKNTKTIN